MNFVDVKNDIAFRKIFGDEKKKAILVSFINAVTRREGDDRIDQISITDPFQAPILPHYKTSIIDVRARDLSGKTYLIEMQMVFVTGIGERILYYMSKEYSGQIQEGEKYHELTPVIFIGVFNFNLTRGRAYLSHHAICDVETRERIIDGMDFYLIETPKFNLPPDSLTSITDKWIYFLKEAKNLDLIPDNVDDEGLKAAYLSANRETWSKDELDAYIDAGMVMQDERGKIEHALQQGKEDGKREEKIKIATSMKNMGSAIDFIVAITGLSKEEIENL